MKAKFLPVTFLALFLAFGCAEGTKVTNASASPSTSSGAKDNAPANASQPKNDDAATASDTSSDETNKTPANEEVTILQAKIDNTIINVEWEDNEAVKALKEMAKAPVITVNMSRYGGFEQVGDLGQALPRNDSQTTTAPGDIVLYSGDKIVIFFGSNSWSYTRLGKVTNKSEAELKALLDKDNVTLYLSLAAETQPEPGVKKAD